MDKGKIELTDGHAVTTGCGVFVMYQVDDRGEGQTVVLTEDDLRLLLATGEPQGRPIRSPFELARGRRVRPMRGKKAPRG